MSRKFFQRAAVLMTILIAAAFVVPVAVAQTDDSIELVGVVESMTTNSITVSQQVVDISAAEINTPLEIGSVVKVQGTLAADGSIIAREVNPSQDGILPGEFEITGTLQQIGSGFIVVSGQTISVVGAEIKNALVVGELVKVHVTLVNGALTAREVENAVADDDNDDNANANDNDASDNANANDDNFNDNDDNVNANDNDDNTNDNTSTAAVSVADAVSKVLAVYPNTTIVRIELTTKFGGTLVWEVKTANGVEVIIDATTGAILTIDERGGGNGGDDNLNNNNNRDDDNANANDNNNDNDDDNSNDNANNNDNDDDSSGMGGDDSGDDDGGMGGDG